MKDDKGIPLLALNTAIPVEQNHSKTSKATASVEEKNNNHVFQTLTRRELEVLKLMAKGLCSCMVARQLFISEETAATHRKNIKRKINARTSYDIFRFAQSFGLI